MVPYYKAGEQKIRPGIYQRYSTNKGEFVAAADDGTCAIPIKSAWGPLNTVTAVTNTADLYKLFGEGDYSPANTVPAAAKMFEGGASRVYVYRLGTGGTQSSFSLKVNDEDAVTVRAKYPGDYDLAVSLQAKLGSTDTKEFKVYHSDALLETFSFTADGTTEVAGICAAVKSAYVELSGVGEVEGALTAVAAVAGSLTGGSDPTVTTADYSSAYAALEPYYYNVIALDSDDDSSMSRSLLLASYLATAHEAGKLGVAVIGEKSSVDFSTRCQHAQIFDDEKIVFLGNGYINSSGEKIEGALAACYTAGLIAATPTNQGIVHAVIDGAVNATETLTNTQYETAILSGMLMLSVSATGEVWYDSGVNTLTNLGENQDAGWKKIRRTKTRMEIFHRLDVQLAPKVGKLNTDSDGVGDVIQSAQRVLDTMVAEKKLYPGASFTLDPIMGFSGDSAWFLIDAVDIDSLEKIYLHYRFPYSQS